MDKKITLEQLNAYEAAFDADRANQVAMRAVTTNGVVKAATEPARSTAGTATSISISLEQGNITNQKQSGRCWMFAALNTMRFAIMKKLDLDTFELSQNYTLFYDKLEKANYFLESILDTLEEPTSGRVIAHLLMAPLNDGGQWDMFCNLIEKYGVVPKDAMPETVCSSATREMAGYMTRKLREYACTLRTGHQNGKSLEELRQEKDAMMATIYNMLCVCLGKPPKTVTLEVRNKKKEFIRDTGLTGKEFFQKYVGWDLSQYVSLINAPTADKPYHKTYTVKLLGNVVEGRPVKYLNLPVEDLKAAAIAQMQDGQPVWFGCDVGKCSLREGGVLDLEAIQAGELLRHGLYHGQSPAAGLRRKPDDPRHGVPGGGFGRGRQAHPLARGEQLGQGCRRKRLLCHERRVVQRVHLPGGGEQEVPHRPAGGGALPGAHPAGALGPHGLPCLNALETINHRGDLCE